MKLYLMRHGKAEDGFDIDDYERKLTEKGLAAAISAGHVLASMQIDPVHIYSSPRIRARQTAEAVAAGLKKEIEIQETVNFNFSIQTMWALIEHLTDDQEAMFVGHNPTMTEVVNLLTGAQLVMKPGAIACVDVSRRQSSNGTLAWLLPPKVFLALDGS